MSFLAFDLIEPCFDKTKKLLFPIKKSLWLKLGLITLFLGGSFPNFSNRLPFDSLGQYWILLIVGIAILFGFLWLLISAFANFVFVDSVIQKKCLIRKSFSRTAKKALSFFGLNVLVNIILILVVLVLALPFIGKFFGSSFNTIGYLLLLIPLVLILLLIMVIVGFVISQLVLPDLYFHKVKALVSFRRMLKMCKKNFVQVLIFALMLAVLGIASAIISLFVILLLLFVFGVIAAILFGVGYLLSLVIPTIVMIGFGVFFGIILLLLLVYTISVFLVPIPVFFMYYKLEFFKKLIKLK